MIKWAVVTSVSPFNVKFDGETTASPKAYKKPKGYTPTLNDRVCFLVVNKQYVCLGGYE